MNYLLPNYLRSKLTDPLTKKLIFINLSSTTYEITMYKVPTTSLLTNLKAVLTKER